MRFPLSRRNRKPNKQYVPGFVNFHSSLALERREMAATIFSLTNAPGSGALSGYMTSSADAWTGPDNLASSGILYMDPVTLSLPGDGTTISHSSFANFVRTYEMRFDDDYNEYYVPDLLVSEAACSKTTLTGNGYSGIEVDSRLHTADSFTVLNPGTYFLNTGTFGVPTDGPFALANAYSTAPVWYQAANPGASVTVSLSATLSPLHSGFDRYVTLDIESSYIDVHYDSYTHTGLVVTDHDTGTVLYSDPSFGDLSVASTVDVSYSYSAKEYTSLQYSGGLRTGPIKVVTPADGTLTDSQATCFHWDFQIQS